MEAEACLARCRSAVTNSAPWERLRHQTACSSSRRSFKIRILNGGRGARPFLTLCCSVTSSSSDKDNANGADALQVSSLRSDKASGGVGADDLLKLFNDAQQNMLYLSRQRITALENLEKAERENTLLLAKLAHLEAENRASSAGCEVLQNKLKAIEDELEAQGINWTFGDEISKDKADPPSLWSELSLTIDSFVLRGKIDVGQATSLRGLVLNRDAGAAAIFSTFRNEGEDELLGGLLALLDPNRRCSLHIVHICTEMAPLTKVGTLGSFITSLSRALRRKRNHVEVILPKYTSMDLSSVHNLTLLEADFSSYFDGNWHHNKIWTGTLYGVAIVLIDPSHPRGLFSREHVYDYEDDFERFTYFSRAALDYILKAGKCPDILHIHNWQTAAVAPLLWDVFASQGLGQARILFTFHNIGPQHLHEPHKLSFCGLDPWQLHRIDRLQDDLEARLANLLKGGIVYSNKVTTVSPTFAHDLLTKEHGQGLSSTLQMHQNKFVGILNGLDDSIWDPRKDQHLPCMYNFENPFGKRKCKEELLKRLGFPCLDLSVPLVGCMVFDLSEVEFQILDAAVNFTSGREAQFVFVGGCRNPRAQSKLETMKSSQKNTKSQIVTNHDEGLVHLVVAASDVLICPPFSEPANQTPLIAMKYGTIPIARSTNGHFRYFIDAESQGSRAAEMARFTFASLKASDIIAALSHALDRMEKDPIGWKILISNVMRIDLSWDTECVDKYLEAYHSIRSL